MNCWNSRKITEITITEKVIKLTQNPFHIKRGQYWANDWGTILGRIKTEMSPPPNKWWICAQTKTRFFSFLHWNGVRLTKIVDRHSTLINTGPKLPKEQLLKNGWHWVLQAKLLLGAFCNTRVCGGCHLITISISSKQYKKNNFQCLLGH